MQTDGEHHECEQNCIRRYHSKSLSIFQVISQEPAPYCERKEHQRQSEQNCCACYKEPVPARVEAAHAKKQKKRNGKAPKCPQPFVLRCHERHDQERSRDKEGSENNKEPIETRS